MKLIKDWRRCLRMFSVQAMLIASAVQGAWLFLPADMRATVPEPWVQVMTILLLVLGIFGRLVVQPKVSET